jgi:hypothetical protein
VNNFQRKIELILGSMLNAFGYKEATAGGVVANGRIALRFLGPSFEIEIYQSSADGEINCLVRRRNEADADWHYLRSVVGNYDQVDESALFEAVPEKPLGEDEQLALIKNDLQLLMEKDQPA